MTVIRKSTPNDGFGLNIYVKAQSFVHFFYQY